MLPSGIVCTSSDGVRLNEVGSGLYVAQDAYKGQYDFFAPSPVYATAAARKSGSGPVDREIRAVEHVGEGK